MGEAHIPGDAYRLMGVIAREDGDLVEAETMLQRAAEVASARHDMLLLAETSREQAEVHRRQGRNRETLQALNRAHKLFTQLRAVTASASPTSPARSPHDRASTSARSSGSASVPSSTMSGS